MDLLGRLLRNQIDIVEQLQKRGVGFSRRLIQERTQAGLTSARARGKKGGRPKIFNDDGAP
jgi:DNA invertase Pin-like site-specific DNA recombinase